VPSELLLRYPVATSKRVEPTAKGLLEGVIVIEVIPGSARLEAWYESVLASVTPLLIPPTRSTLPSVSNVAVWPERPAVKAWLEVKLYVCGLYSSLVASDTHDETQESKPPARYSWPFVNIVAV